MFVGTAPPRPGSRLAVIRAWRLPAIPAYAVVALLAFVLVALPQTTVIRGVGAALTPARLLAAGCLLWWLTARINNRLGMRPRRSAVRTALCVAVSIPLISSGLAFARGMGPTVAAEVQRDLLVLVLFCGVALLAVDAIRELRAVQVVFAVFSIAVALSAFAAVVQYLVGVDLRPLTGIPPLVSVDVGYIYLDRGGLTRAFGLANHPIELAALCSTALPMTLHLIRHDHRRRVLWWGCLALQVAGPVVSISRTGMLGVVIVALAMRLRMTLRHWLGVGVAAIAALAAVALVVPRLAEVLQETVTRSTNDYSITTRLNDYPYVAARLAEHPLLGQGFGSYLAPPQPYLDNQYLFTLVEAGLLGGVALVTLLAVPTVVAVRLWWRHRVRLDPTGGSARADVAWALAVAMVVLIVSFATFDALSFPQYLGATFLIVGLVGGLAAAEPEPNGDVLGSTVLMGRVTE